MFIIFIIIIIRVKHKTKTNGQTVCVKACKVINTLF